MFPSSFCPRHMEGSGIFLGFLRILIKGKRKKKKESVGKIKEKVWRKKKEMILEERDKKERKWIERKA